MDIEIELIKNPNHHDAQFASYNILQKLAAFDDNFGKAHDVLLGFRDQNGVLKASLTAHIVVGGFLIEGLYVDLFWRGKGVGRALLNAAEKMARENKCHFLSLHTMYKDIVSYYQLHGYVVEFVQDGYWNDNQRIFMRKDL